MRRANGRSHHLRILCAAALLAALSIVLGKYLAINVTDSIRFSFENLSILLAGIFLGPLVGGIVGAVADLVGCLMVGYAINPLITLGAVGVISVIGNALPYEFSRMVRLALRGEYPQALEIHHRFTELFKLLVVDGNPAGVKALLSEMGLIQNELRLPLVPARLGTEKRISELATELGIRI